MGITILDTAAPEVEIDSPFDDTIREALTNAGIFDVEGALEFLVEKNPIAAACMRGLEPPLDTDWYREYEGLYREALEHPGHTLWEHSRCMSYLEKHLAVLANMTLRNVLLSDDEEIKSRELKYFTRIAEIYQIAAAGCWDNPERLIPTDEELATGDQRLIVLDVVCFSLWKPTYDEYEINTWPAR
ncbi:MAG: hypothetical protein QY318_00050 [Candidatus Dojkabacteria bacterium]|nr:MAG: hypothetical protein QY318_00050 [Candidatus Dojkabacteria bacterium]